MEYWLKCGQIRWLVGEAGVDIVCAALGVGLEKRPCRAPLRAPTPHRS